MIRRVSEGARERRRDSGRLGVTLGAPGGLGVIHVCGSPFTVQFSLFSFPEFSEKVFFSTLPKPQRSNRRKRPYRLRFFQESVGPLYYNGRFPAQAQGGTLHEPMGKARFLYFIRKPKFGPVRLYCVLLPQLAGPPLRTDKNNGIRAAPLKS